MEPPKRTKFNMVSRKHFSHFYLPFAYRPTTSESDLLENVDIGIFAMDISYTPSPSKISSRSSKLSISMHHFSSRLWLWKILPNISTSYTSSTPLSVSPRLWAKSQGIYMSRQNEIGPHFRPSFDTPDPRVVLDLQLRDYHHKLNQLPNANLSWFWKPDPTQHP